MSLDGFWAAIDHQLEQLRTATTVDEVIGILGGKHPDSSGDAFFAGGGGDGSVYESLREAGWEVAWFDAGYYWAMRTPDGRDGITYVEGDIMRGVRKPVF
jgi:hypothetical protein